MTYQIETENWIAQKMIHLLYRLGALKFTTFVSSPKEAQVIAQSVLEGYQEMRRHQKNGTKPQKGEAFLAEMRKEFAE